MTSSWKVELVGAEDQTPLKTTCLEGGKIYFHAEPGKCFRVKVINTERDPSLERVVITLKIDGDDVGYQSRFNLRDRYTMFDGIYKSIYGVNKKYHFKFSETQLVHASEIFQPAVKKTGEETNTFSAGSIEVEIFEAVEDMDAEPRVFNPQNKGLPSENKKIDKEKEFWKQPSVTTACSDEGRLMTARAPSRPWKKVSQTPLFTFTGFYHTLGVIKILKSLYEPSPSPTSGPGTDAEAPFSSPGSMEQPAHEIEVIDLTRDDWDDNHRSSTTKKRRRSNESLPTIII